MEVTVAVTDEAAAVKVAVELAGVESGPAGVEAVHLGQIVTMSVVRKVDTLVV